MSIRLFVECWLNVARFKLRGPRERGRLHRDDVAAMYRIPPSLIGPPAPSAADWEAAARDSLREYYDAALRSLQL